MAARASCPKQCQQRQQQSPSASSAWKTSKRQPAWPSTCTASALPASSGKPGQDMSAQSAGRLHSSYCTQCKGMTTMSSKCSLCPPSWAGGWPWRAPAASPLSSATDCTGCPPTTTPWLVESGLWEPTTHRGRLQLWCFQTPPPGRLPHPALFGSQYHWVQASAWLALLLVQTHVKSWCVCSLSTFTSSTFTKHPDASQVMCISGPKSNLLQGCFPTLSQQCGKAKGDNLSERTIDFISPKCCNRQCISCALAASHSQAPGQGCLRIFSSVPWQPAFECLRVHEYWSVLKKCCLKVHKQAIPLCCKPSKQGRRPAWLNRELLFELRRKKRLDEL